MNPFRTVFTTAALSTLLVLNIQHSESNVLTADVAIANTMETAIDKNSIAISTDNLAVTTFSFTSHGKTKDGQKINAKQYGSHTWKYLNDEWRLIHELYSKL